MKLSALTTDQIADALVQIAPDIETLMNDTELAEKFKSRNKSSDKNEATKLGMATILNVATYLLKIHRTAAWNILGALNGKTPDEIGNQLFPVTMKQIVEILNDKDLMSFFTPSGQSEPEPSPES